MNKKEITLEYLKKINKEFDCKSLKKLSHVSMISKNKLSKFLFDNDPEFYADVCSNLDIDTPDLIKVIKDIENVIDLNTVTNSNMFKKFVNYIKENPSTSVNDAAIAINSCRKSAFNYQSKLKDKWRELFLG